MAFATKEDIAARLGRSLTAAEESQVALLLEAAQAVIEEAVEKVEADLSPLPPVLRFLTVEKVTRAMGNPQGLASQSEALGAYSHTERFNADSDTDLTLSELETLMARRAVYGVLSGSSEPESLASDEYALGVLAPGSYPWAGEGS